MQTRFLHCIERYKIFLLVAGLLLAGCFAAVTGFLLNFTICESAVAAPQHTPQRQPSANLPLAPDQHRLTDDGDDKAPSAQLGANATQSKQALDRAVPAHETASQADQHIQAELVDADQATSSNITSPALQNVFQQIQVGSLAGSMRAVSTCSKEKELKGAEKTSCNVKEFVCSARSHFLWHVPNIVCTRSVDVFCRH